MYGLVIEKQGIDKILTGEKKVEIRGSKTGITVKDEDGEPIDSPNPLRQSFKNTIKKMQKERNIYCCQNG